MFLGAKRAALDSSLFGSNGLAAGLLGQESSGAVFDFARDYVLVRDAARALNWKGTVQQAIDASVISFTRATTGLYLASNASWTSAASGAWRRHHSTAGVPLGYLPEPQRTNSIRNNSNTGASAPSTLPTNWSSSGFTGLTVTYAYGTESGLPYMDFAVSGTAGDANGGSIRFESTIAASNGQTWTTSLFHKLQAGALTNVTALDLQADYFDSGVNYLSGDYANGEFTPTATMTRKSRTFTIATANTAFQSPYLRLTWANGAALNFTLRIYAAQCELGAYVTSPILTTSATVTRNADVMTVALSKLPFDANAFTMLARLWPNPDNANGSFRALSVNDGGANNRAVIQNGGSGLLRIGSTVVSGGAAVESIDSVSGTAATFAKAALAVATDDFELVVNGASSGTDSAGATPVSPTTLSIGSDRSGVNQYSGPVAAAILIPRRLSAAEMIARTA